MGAGFRAGFLSVVLMSVLPTLVCGVSAQMQTPSGGTSSPSAAGAADCNLHPDSKVTAILTARVDGSSVVGVADNLIVSVWKEGGLSGPVVVSPDGMITLPVIGDVHVVGLTIAQVQDLLTERLKPVVTEPQVAVVRNSGTTSFRCRHPKGYTLEERLY